MKNNNEKQNENTILPTQDGGRLEYNVTFSVPAGAKNLSPEELIEEAFAQNYFCLDALLWAIIGANLLFEDNRFEPSKPQAFANVGQLTLIAVAFARKMDGQFLQVQRILEDKINVEK